MMPLTRSVSTWDIHEPGPVIPRPVVADQITEDDNAMIELRLDLEHMARVLDEDMEPGSTEEINNTIQPDRSCCGCTIL